MPDDAAAEVCPACGHAKSSHPYDVGRGSRICSRAIGELPSCAECAALLAGLLSTQFDGEATPS